MFVLLLIWFHPLCCTKSACGYVGGITVSGMTCFGACPEVKACSRWQLASQGETELWSSTQYFTVGVSVKHWIDGHSCLASLSFFYHPWSLCYGRKMYTVQLSFDVLWKTKCFNSLNILLVMHSNHRFHLHDPNREACMDLLSEYHIQYLKVVASESVFRE